MANRRIRLSSGNFVTDESGPRTGLEFDNESFTVSHDDDGIKIELTGSDISWQPAGVFPTKGTIPSIEWVEHFTSVSGIRGLAASISGTGASFSNEDSDVSQRVGIGNCRSGTDTTGRAAIITGVTAVRLGGGRHRLRWDAKIPTLSDGTDRFTSRLGFIDSTSAEPTDGCYFRQADDVNSGKWQAVTRAAGTETATDTGIIATTSWTVFEIEVNAAATSVAFYIDGVLVATNTTNIPTGGNLTGIGAGIIKSLGTTLRELRLDMMGHSFEPTALL